MKWTLLPRESRASGVFGIKSTKTPSCDMVIAEIPVSIIWAPAIPRTPLVPTGLLAPMGLVGNRHTVRRYPRTPVACRAEGQVWFERSPVNL